MNKKQLEKKIKEALQVMSIREIGRRVNYPYSTVYRKLIKPESISVDLLEELKKNVFSRVKKLQRKNKA